MTLSDKTGAPVAVTRNLDQFTVEVEGKATVLIAEALRVTRTEGLRIVAVCPMVAAYVGRHHEFDDILDAPTPELLRWLQER